MTKERPKVNSEGQKELDRCIEQFDKFDSEIKEMTQDRMSLAPKQDVEPQTKIAQRDMDKQKQIYLKPTKTVSSAEKFNETYRDDYNYMKEYVQFIAENKELTGEAIELWTKPFAGMPAEFWTVPVNKPIWGPRYLAEQIKSKVYHRLIMQQNSITAADGMGQYYGQLAVDTEIRRLSAEPVSGRRSIFMGAANF